jgi:hypothetical protein
MIDEKLADEILVDGRAVSNNRFHLKIQILLKGKTIYSNTFAIPWKAGSHGTV